MTIGKGIRQSIDKMEKSPSPGPSAYYIPSTFINKWNKRFNQVFSLKNSFHSEKKKDIKILKCKILKIKGNKGKLRRKKKGKRYKVIKRKYKTTDRNLKKNSY